MVFIIMELMITENQKSQLQRRVETMITTVGLLDAIKMVGGYSTFLKIMKGVDWRSSKNIIPAIEKIISEYDYYLTMLDIDLNPIVISDENNILCQIEMIYEDGAHVYCYGGYKYETELDDYVIKYEQLDSFDLYTIFDGLMEYYEK